MGLSQIQKRKWPGRIGEREPHLLRAHKDFRSSPPTASLPFVTNDENNLFPSDQITSDSTFFDDYMSTESTNNLRLTSELVETTPPTSPIGHPRIASSPPPDSNIHRSLAFTAFANARKQKRPRYINKPSPSRSTTAGAKTELKHRELTSDDVQEDENVAQERVGISETDGAETRLRALDAAAQRLDVLFAPMQAQTSTVSEIEPEPNAVSSMSTAPDPEGATIQDATATETAEPTVTIPSSLTTQPDRFVNERVFTWSTAVLSAVSETPETVRRRSKRLRPTPAQVRPDKQARKATADTKKTSIEKRHGSLEFHVTSPRPAQAYLVKHQSESQMEAGEKWSQKDNRTFFHVQIAKHARIKYTVGDIVDVTFSKGQGGAAKIVELRMADSLLIVVQWLYSRQDVVDSGGIAPRLEQWPQGVYMLSDHFQIVCIDNVAGRSSAIPLEDVYWAAVSRRMQPSAEIEAVM